MNRQDGPWRKGRPMADLAESVIYSIFMHQTRRV